MKSVPILLTLLVIGCGHAPNPSPTSDLAAMRIPNLGQFSMGHPITREGVTLVPVLQDKPVPLQAEYITLSEAKKNGWVEVFEIPGREQVERLQVRNVGPRPLLLLAGELLLGGKQDRVVAKDTIIGEGESKDVEVFCVEHGRWSGEHKRFNPSGAMVPSSVRRRAMYEGQEQVWAEVENFNEKASVARSGGSSVRLGIDQSTVRERVRRGIPELLAALPKDERLVGIVILVNGEIQSFELFGSSKLLRDSLETILTGAFAEAAVSKATPREPDIAEVAEFISISLSSNRSQTASGSNPAYAIDAEAKGSELGEEGYSGNPQTRNGPIVHGSYSR